jgi:hypothetical protein
MIRIQAGKNDSHKKREAKKCTVLFEVLDVLYFEGWRLLL